MSSLSPCIYPLTTMSTSGGTSWSVHPAKMGLVVAPRPLLRNTWSLRENESKQS